MSISKGRNLGLRLDENDTSDLNNFEKATGIEATTLARAGLRACLAYWKRNGSISFPLRIVEERERNSLSSNEKINTAASQNIKYAQQAESPGIISSKLDTSLNESPTSRKIPMTSEELAAKLAAAGVKLPAKKTPRVR